ncbi:MAG: hypothetical protein IKS08_03820 [Alphaproteobacteria bacterium]|nr:hypothetical protein [Alphaproteobacteria bacterium]
METSTFFEFKAVIHNPTKPTTWKVAGLNDLQYTLINYGPNDMDIPYSVTILCKKYLLNVSENPMHIPAHQRKKYRCGHPIISSEDKGKIEIITPKLIYPNDVRDFLINTYGSTLNFNIRKFDSKRPVFLQVYKQKNAELNNSKTKYFVSCRSLLDSDIVVDENLKKLWKTNTGKKAEELQEFFNQKIYS